MLLVMLLADHLRLVNGGSPCAGRVEVYHDGQWVTVSGYGSGDRGWDMADAAVVCKELGCGAALSASGDAHFGEGSGPVVTAYVRCRGSESTLRDCQSQSWSHYSWSHSYDVGVICSGTQWHLRLESGGSRCDGRVEIYHNGTWGRLLDDSWNISDGDVICRQLNCGSAISVYNSSQYGEGTGPVWLNNVQCVGNETHIWNCPLSTVASTSRTSRDVGVVCSDHKQLRLVDDGSSCSGTVEVYRHGDWRRVRDQFWDLNDTKVVCRQMGCGPAIRAYNSPVHREGERSPWLKYVHCQGNETNLLKCKPSRRNQSTENMSDVGVQCSKDTHIRLMDGGSSCAGRVEIYYNETWGTVCDDSWGSLEADVVCKQLGCGSAVDAISAAPCGSASGQVWLDEVRCSGKESALWECASSPWGQHDCGHKEDVSIVCSEHKMLRLMNGQHSCEGRVEVFYNETWGTVCSDVMGIELMGLEAAEVICKQLDCGRALDVDHRRKFGEGSGPIWLDDIACNSNESFLWQCSSPPWGEHNCDHREDVGVICSGQELRLVGGSSICSGRVEILSNKTWGTVCDDSWDIREASVVCGQLDCGPAVRAVGQAGFGQGAGQIWLDELHCRGSESFLWDCVSASAGRSDCVHKEDAGVVCSVQLVNIPFVVCIVLGILLAVVLFALIVQMDSNSSGRGETGL
ncbi:deleted in malignant brain tumors 1 protein-like [Callorhinchus milii]|uniref:deleted in malignant brain tumors 1 protein-like n=1 Tax=Callorhinchus milii TaxID=7868 RepID=UPI001C3F7BDB|nr:deleted in malignant brain tumors 1 protein-like [Callorhinchus milii]